MMVIVTAAAAVIGLLAAGAYATRRRWIDAALALVAGVALAGIVGDFALPGDAGITLTVDAARPPLSLAGVRALRLSGDGLRAAEWDDLPARPLAWTQSGTPAIRLDFPRTLALGRVFTLTVHRSWTGPGRLQLLAENDQVLSEAKGDGDLAVQWLPPVAERLVLKARLLDAAGKVVDAGPVPFTVAEPAPLQVRGRFGAPSFDLRVLDDLLVNSRAVVDWQVALGKGLERTETARAEMAAPDLEIVDAAWFEQAGAAARGALLARVAGGTPLLVLGANARDARTWTRTLGLPLVPQPANKTFGAVLTMASAGLDPNADRAGDWTGADGLWTRDWQRGRIAWLGVGDWHRYAIEQPRRLVLWWQDVLDRLRVQRRVDVAWLVPDEMPLPHRRLAVCARGARGAVTVPALGQTLTWQRRPEQVDAACAAVWPAASGWLQLRAGADEEQVYVYAPGDWPLWQRGERRAATARYAARTPAPVAAGTRPLLAWPFGVAFALAMLGLWWRERR
jgi:hypothetical protein